MLKKQVSMSIASPKKEHFAHAFLMFLSPVEDTKGNVHTHMTCVAVNVGSQGP